MGWHPDQVKNCTVWDFWAAWSGFYEHNSGPEEQAPMTRNRLDELLKDYDPNGRRT